MEIIKEGQNDITSQLDKIKESLDELSAQISDHYANKDKIREAYYEQCWNHEVQRDRIQYLKDLHAQKERLIEMDQHLKESEEIAQQQIKDWPHPYAKEIETCDHLSSYLHQMKRKAGLEVDEEVAAKEI